tara:strand:+ start:681 stop:1256 length:576 start_codon:yes stop_codon:yes gene_type:complete
MNSLLELYNSKERLKDDNNPFYTDKEFYHNYITEYYGAEFAEKRDTPLNILEIGMYRGGSVRLWLEWFNVANIVGIDNNPSYFLGEITDPRAKTLFEDAYSIVTVDKFENEIFDYIVDDGPHSLESQITAVILWAPKLKRGGKFVIEDIRSVAAAESIRAAVVNMKFSDIRIIDLTSERFWEYNVLLEITK